MSMFDIYLDSLEQTAELGRILADIFRGHEKLRALLLRGSLGSGKTALASAIVKNLERGEKAEVSSPSFTVCNMYDTVPGVAHCDLYRIERIDDEIREILDGGEYLCMIEWAEFVPADALPPDYLDICMSSCDSGKLATIGAAGECGLKALAALKLKGNW